MEVLYMDSSILIVDDETRMRKLVKDFLKQKNFNIIEAEDGEQALTLFNQNKRRIHLVILDVRMSK